MTTSEELAAFVQTVDYASLSDDVVDETKKRVLDSIGIALGAVGADPVAAVRATVRQEGGDACSLWASDTRATPSGAAMYNTVLTRYLDFMDSFLAPGETPHPSDNIGTVLTTGELVEATGRDLIRSTATAYEIQGELAWNAPVRDKGFDHVTHTVISQAAAAADLLDLERRSIRDALGIAGTAHNALRVTRTGRINEWKGVASGNAARNGTYAALLAANGMEGPPDLFEGQKGWKQVIAGDFSVDLDPACPRVFDVMTKRYVAETYAQSAVEGVIELAERHDIDHESVTAIHLDTFHGAKLIIGGGEGDRHVVETKAQADHSLPYMLAAALIDRQMLTEQYTSDRINAPDVQRLLKTVTVEEDETLTERFEAGEMPAIIDIDLDDGTTYHVEKDQFHGHPNSPMEWPELERKFHALASSVYGERRREKIVDCIRTLEECDAADLVDLLD